MKGNILKISFSALLALSLCGCNQELNTDDIREDLDGFLVSCSSADAVGAITYLAPVDEIEGYSEVNSKDTSGLAWARIPEAVTKRMPDNNNASVEAWKYVGYGLQLVYGDYEIQEIECVADSKNKATAKVSGHGPSLEWESIDNIYDLIAKDTEKEFKSDYSYYKEKIEDSSQAEVFNDLRNKSATAVFKTLNSKLDDLEKFDYIDEFSLIKDSNGDWKVSKIVKSKVGSTDGDN